MKLKNIYMLNPLSIICEQLKRKPATSGLPRKHNENLCGNPREPRVALLDHSR